MRLAGTKFLALRHAAASGLYTQAFLARKRQRDAAWELASVRIRENWAGETALKLISQSDAEWNYVLSREWDKVKLKFRAIWERSRD